jgi:tetratricopeptide (TPR) repeat protein
MCDNKESNEAADYLKRLGDHFLAKGGFEKSIEYHGKALEIMKKNKRNFHDIIESLLSLTNVYMMSNHFNKAGETLKEAEEITKKQKCEDNKKKPDDYMADICFYLGNYHESQKDYEKSESYHRKSLDLKLRVNSSYGEDHFSTAASYLNYGKALRKMLKPSEGLEQMKKAKKILEEIYYDNYPQICDVNLEIGKTYLLLSDFMKAIEHLNIVKIKWKNWDPNGSDTAKVYSYLGETYSNLKEYTHAESYYKQSLELYQTIYGNNHMTCASCYNNLGLIYKNLGDYDKAKTELDKALKIFESQEEKDLNMINSCKMNIGLNYASSGDSREAEKYLNDVLKYRQNLPNNLLELSDIYFNLACINQNSSSHDEKTKKYFNECLELRKKAFKEDHFDIASIHHNFGLFNLSRNEEDAAKEKFNKVLKIYENLYKDYDPFSAEFCSQIAKTLFEKKKFDSSVEFYNKSIDFRKKMIFNHSVAFFSKLSDDELKAKEKSNKSEMVDTYFSLGKVYYNELNESKKAKENFELGLKILSEIEGEKETKSKEFYKILHEVCSKLGEANLAQEYLKKSK